MLVSSRQSENGSGDGMELEEAKKSAFDPRTVEIRVIVYADAKI
jgi:hypothetical protein